MKRKSFKFQKMVAMTLSAIMVVQFTPKELLKVLAEEVSSAIEQLENQKEEIQYSTVLTDGNNIGTSDIIQENVRHRTLTSKEYLMSDDTIMVQQFNKPIHYYVNGEYIEIDKAEKELQAEATTDLSNATTSGNFESVNVFENTENVTAGDSVSAGKINGEEKIDLFLNFKLPSVEPYYQLIGAKIKFEYQTQGASLFDSKDYSYNVYVAESESNLKDITYDSKPQKIQSLKSINQSSQLTEKEFTYESGVINVNNITDGIITLGIESKDETSSESYIATVSESVETTTFYKIVSGIKDEYSLESFEIDGATAYVNSSAGDLTLVCDLLSIETMSDMPFAASLIYNTNYDALLNEFGKVSSTGKGFKLNFQQYMLLDNSVYYLIDADGSISSFYSLGNGDYYSKDKKLYYTADATIVGKGTLRDLSGNQMLFENGCLVRIISGVDASEFISIDYLSNTERITKVSYYCGADTPKYEMKFEYNASGNLWKVTTGIGLIEYAKRIMTYDEDGYLTGIKNNTGLSDTDNGIYALTVVYLPTSDSSLAELYNNRQEGLMFSRIDDKEFDIYYYRGITSSLLHARVFNQIKFYFNGKQTRIIYWENHIKIGEKYRAFNDFQEVISEWEQDSAGNVSVNNKTNWSNSKNEPYDYIDGYCSYLYKAGGNDNVSIGVNQEKTISLESPFAEADQSKAYTSALSFRVFAGEEIDCSITISSNNAVNIQLEKGIETYISIPCSVFVGEITVKVKNNSNENSLSLYDFNYGVVNYMEQEYTYDSAIKAHKLASTESNLKNGINVTTSYDDKQRVESVVTQNLGDTETLETITYTYVETGIWKDGIESIETKDKDNIQTELTTYAYQGSKNDYTVTQTTTKGELKQRSILQQNTVGNETTVSYTDENGESYKEYYALLNGDIRLQKVEYDNLYEQYAYNNWGQITSIDVYNSATNAAVYSQTDTYDENGVYIGSGYNGNNFTYGYEEGGFVSSIKYKSSSDMLAATMLSYSYNSDSVTYGVNQIERKTYANTHMESYTYTQNKTSVVHTNEDFEVTAQYAYEYDDNQNLISQTKLGANNYLAIQYAYNNDDIYKPQLAISGGDFMYSVDYIMDIDPYTNQPSKVMLSSVGRCSSEESYESNYTYDLKGRLETMSYGWYDSSLSYDKLGRVVSYVAKYNNSTVRTTSYQYATNGEYTTNRLTKITNSSQYDPTNSTMTYYPNGYVKSIEYGNMESEYEYDAFGRLTKETNNGLSTTYSYDANNNVQASGLTYENGVLTAVNDAPINYDELGNPTTYKGETFVWEQGRKLASGRLNGKNFTYSYDGNGMRYQKIVNGVETEYYYNGAQLLMENRGGSTDRIYYIYDASGGAGILIGGSYYYFDKNTLGDVVAIRNEVGVILAQYEYDAWGNHTVTDRYGNVNTNSTFIGNINPIRYRGYYYDTETGFYYLQTRYYDPSICRFINADNYELVAELSSVVGQLNMYAYCGNNPIMYTDPTGEIAGWIIGLIAVGIILTASDIYNVVENVDYTVSKDGQSVSIENSQTIITPWVRWGYSFYLNHINAETKGIIKGSSVGVEYEWFLHNAAYWLGISRSQASPVDIGASIFSDNHPGLGDLMKVSYIILQHPVYTIWDLIANKGYGGR